MGIITSAVVATAIASSASAPSAAPSVTSGTKAIQSNVSTISCALASQTEAYHKCLVFSFDDKRGTREKVLISPAQYAGRAGFKHIHRSYVGVLNNYEVIFIEVSN